jgi:hypothetical protein
VIYSIPLLLVPFLAADPLPSDSPADQLVRLAKEGTAIQANFYAELTKAGHEMPRVTAANEKYRAESSGWAARASALLKAHPAEPATLDVILAMSEIHYVDDETVAILREHHFASPKVLALLNSFSQDSPGPRRRFADDLADKHPDRTVRAKATLALGRMNRIYLIDGLTHDYCCDPSALTAPIKSSIAIQSPRLGMLSACRVDARRADLSGRLGAVCCLWLAS